jgi:hypothetical protein
MATASLIPTSSGVNDLVPVDDVAVVVAGAPLAEVELVPVGALGEVVVDDVDTADEDVPVPATELETSDAPSPKLRTSPAAVNIQ